MYKIWWSIGDVKITFGESTECDAKKIRELFDDAGVCGKGMDEGPPTEIGGPSAH